MKTSIKHVFFLIVIVLGTNLTASSQEIFNRPATGSQIDSGRWLYETDVNYNLPNKTQHSAAMKISLGILDDVVPTSGSSFMYQVEVEITTRNLTSGNYNVPFSRVLSINYSSQGNLTQNAFGAINDLDVLKIDNAYDMKVEIVGLSITNINGSAMTSSQISNVYFNLEFESDYSQLVTSQIPSVNIPQYFSYPVGNMLPTTSGSNAADEVLLSWQPINGAKYYELQWTWVDNYDGIILNQNTFPAGVTYSNKLIGDISSADIDFEHNNTSLLLDSNQYKLPLIYDDGYIIYRIRAVGINVDALAGNTTESLVYGKWSINGTDNSTADFFNYIRTFANQSRLNWQVQTSYAENGKKKDVISYMDGSLRNRQTITKINTDNTTIVGEAIYDHVGRPVVEILPAPAAWGSLKYHPDFNQNITGNRYSFLDFDFTDSSSPSTTTPYPAMSNGAALYYSNDAQLKINERDQFIPNAKGFPFSVTEFTNDNTGRIKRKSGVGEEHALNSGHEMKYFYGTPNQFYLNRLFGTNVGLSRFYKRNIVIDPNGQSSISYIDPSGKTIATALMDKSPDNLIALEDSVAANTILTLDLLNKIATDAVDSEIDNNYKIISGNSTYNNALHYQGEQFIFGPSNKGSLGLNYVLSGTAFSPAYCDDLFPVTVDYSVSVTDFLGNELVQSPASVLPITGSHTFSTNTITDTTNRKELTSTIDDMPTGQYTINKIIKVNEAALEEQLQAYINNCLSSPDDFDISYLFNLCDLTCTECIEFGQVSRSSYIDSEIANIPLIQGYRDEQDLDDIREIIGTYYDEIVNGCDATCNGDSNNPFDTRPWQVINEASCVGNAIVLAGHFSPGAQYARDGGESDYSIYSTNAGANNGHLPNAGPNVLNGFIWQNPVFEYGNLQTQQTQPINYYVETDALGNPVLENPSNSSSNLLPVFIRVRKPIDVTTINDGSTYVPEIENTSVFDYSTGFGVIEDSTDSDYVFVNPKNLADEADFRDNYESNWGYSLLRYHPEYGYLKLYDKLCSVAATSGTNTFRISSESYDVSLRELESPLFSYNGGSNNKNILPNNGDLLTQIMAYDPFFAIDYSSHGWNDDLTKRQEWMLGVLEGPYFDIGLPSQQKVNLFTYSYLSVTGFDGGIYNVGNPSHSPNTSPSWTDYDTILTEEQKTEFLAFYIAGYLNAKRIIQDFVINHTAYANNFYAGCIGNDGNANYHARKIDDFSTLSMTSPTVWDVINNSNQNFCDLPRTAANTLELSTNFRVFKPADYVIPHDSDINDFEDSTLEDFESTYLLENGGCSIEGHFEYFLNGFFKEANTEATVNIPDPAKPRRYISRNLLEAMGVAIATDPVQPPDPNIFSNISSSNLTLNILTAANQNGCSTINISSPANSPSLTWNNYGSAWKITNFKYVNQVAPTTNNAPYNFTILATIVSPLNSETEREVVLSGSTCILLSACRYNLVNGVYTEINISELGCDKKKNFTESFTQFLNGMLTGGPSNVASNLDLSTVPVFTSSGLESYLNTNYSSIINNSNNQVTNYLWNLTDANGDFTITKNGIELIRFKRTTNSSLTNANNILRIQNLDSVTFGNESYNTASIYYTENGSLVEQQASIELWHPYNTEMRQALNFECCPDDSSFSAISDPIANFVKQRLVEYNADPSRFANFYTVPTATAADLLTHYPFLNGGSADMKLYRFNVSDDAISFAFSPDDAVDVRIERHNHDYNSLEPITISYSLQFNFANTNLPFQGFTTTFNDLDKGLRGDYRNAIYIYKGDPNNPQFKIYLKDPRSCVDCIPVKPNIVNCDEVSYTSYTTTIRDTGGYAAGTELPVDYLISNEEFCENNLSWSLEAYNEYLNYLTSSNSSNGMTGLDHPLFVSLNVFASSALGNGHPDLVQIVDSYFATPPVNEPTFYDLYSWTSYAQALINKEIATSQSYCPTVAHDINTPTIIAEDPCSSLSTNLASAYSNDLYARYIADRSAYFRKAYTDHALNTAVETLNATVADLEYQYTLYYYDQAGNLVQTVPPEGVNLGYKDQANAPARQASINTARVENTVDTPIHKLTTKYTYNSLNQLVWQSTPDGGETRFAYDKLGRIIASQNANQQSLTTGPVYNTTISGNAVTFQTTAGMERLANGDIKKITSASWYNFDAFSDIAIQGDGYVERTVRAFGNSTRQFVFIGLSSANRGAFFDMNYAIYNNIIGSNVLVQARKNNSRVGSDHYRNVQVGDVFKVERKNGQIFYYHNNEQLGESIPDITNGAPLFMDLAAYDNGMVIGNPTIVNTSNEYEKFSYTKYDALSRISEAGEMLLPLNQYVINEEGRLMETATNALAPVDNLVFPSNISRSRFEITKTTYDHLNITNASAWFQNYSPENTRNRVVSVEYYEALNNAGNYDNALIYDYDVHGNVKEVVTHINEQFLNDVDAGHFSVLYDYDLISGNVNEVIYQKGKKDQFMHRYEYDADNRIQLVRTSKDGIIWEQDASYEYYRHGPLARVNLGDKKVQGIDYAYTIHGWLKTVNGEYMQRDREIGQDGYSLPKIATAIDAFGYGLHYYNNDYNAANSANVLNSAFATNPKTLYNGNINRMVTALLDTDEKKIETISNGYEYDQLNRIKAFQSEGDSGSVNYGAEYAFDRNGNLTTLSRKRKDGQRFDDFEYHYLQNKNQLDYVTDSANAALHESDIDPGQGPGNYKYDAIGQLIEDVDEQLTINWRVDGKVKEIKKDNGSIIKFEYDPLGNRIAKHVDNRNTNNPLFTTTYYIRDASGNVMSTYENVIASTPSSGTNFELSQTERHIYGSSRLGLEKTDHIVANGVVSVYPNDVNIAKSGNASCAGNGYAYNFDFTASGTIPALWHEGIALKLTNAGDRLNIKAKTTLTNYANYEVIYNLAKVNSSTTRAYTLARLGYENNNGKIQPVISLTCGDGSNAASGVYKLTSSLSSTTDLGIGFHESTLRILMLDINGTLLPAITLTVNGIDYTFNISGISNSLIKVGNGTNIAEIPICYIGSSANEAAFSMCAMEYDMSNTANPNSIKHVINLQTPGQTILEGITNGAYQTSPNSGHRFTIKDDDCSFYVASTCAPGALDSDGDRIPDDCEINFTAASINNADDDGDGIPTSLELGPNYNAATCSGFLDTDSDGTPDFLDTDDDNDGFTTAQELTLGNMDSDGDGNPNYLDTDDDNDLVPTLCERAVSTNYAADATTPNTDHDNDGVLTKYELYADYFPPNPPNPELLQGHTRNCESILDTDGDTIPDYLDPDDDNDGYSTFEERSVTAGQPWFGLDSDSDGTPDFRDPDDSDPSVPIAEQDFMHERIVGDKRYELSNHLGNVLSTISDRKLPVYAGEGDEISMEQLEYEVEGTGDLIDLNNEQPNYYFRTQQQDAGHTARFFMEPGIVNLYVDKLTLQENSVGVFVSLYRLTNGTPVLVERQPLLLNSGSINAFFNISTAGDYKITVTLSQNTSDPEDVFLDDYYLNRILEPSAYLTSLNYFRPDVLSYSDYYPYGMYLPGRHESVDPDGYRYGYQGSELDNEIKGEGNSYFTFYRDLDTRLARWQSRDIKYKSFPWQSPYVSMDNNPIVFNDIFGSSANDWIKNKSGKYINRPDISKKEDTPAGYKYVGKSIQDVYLDYEKNVWYGYWYKRNIQIDWNGQSEVYQKRDNNWGKLKKGDIIDNTVYNISDGIHSAGQWISGKQVPEMQHLDDSSYTYEEGVLGFVGLAAGFISIEARALMSSADELVKVDLMGGKTGTAGYINYDREAISGIKAEVNYFGNYFGANTVDNMVVNNPMASFLNIVTPALKKNSTITIRGQFKNSNFSKIWDSDTIDGYKIISRTRDISSAGYKQTDGTAIKGLMNEIILKKI